MNKRYVLQLNQYGFVRFVSDEENTWDDRIKGYYNNEWGEV